MVRQTGGEALAFDRHCAHRSDDADDVAALYVPFDARVLEIEPVSIGSLFSRVLTGAEFSSLLGRV